MLNAEGGGVQARDADAVQALNKLKRSDLEKQHGIMLRPVGNWQLTQSTYFASKVRWAGGGLTPPATGVNTCSSREFSNLAALEWVISQLEVDEHLQPSPASLMRLKKSWVAGLVPAITSDKRKEKGPVVLQRGSAEAVVVTSP